ncbi:MAG: peptide chain release factor N(5)-glutamine methyltransferase [Bacteroidales bacterium]|nr:peptide chain release factor N(5)-glutamine methyltransferase [Bacteroidales bacterium]
MLLSQFIRESTTALEALYPPQEAKSLVVRLAGELLGVSSYAHIVEPGLEVPEGRIPELRAAMERLLAGEPLQYVLGWQEFCGRRFRVSPAVLIPRPETEQLVAEAEKYVRAGHRVLDLCTGSGCIAWSLALDVPGSIVTGVDISKEALEVARGQFPEGVKFIEADVLQVPESFPGAPFGCIVANPPYIRESEKAFMHRNVLENEPGLALFVPDDDPLRFYRAIAEWARRFLAPGGLCIVEINEGLGTETAALFDGLGSTSVIRDFFSKERFVRVEKRP